MAQRLSFILHPGGRSHAPLSDPWLGLLGYSAMPAREHSLRYQGTGERGGGEPTRDGAHSGVREYAVGPLAPVGAVATAAPTHMIDSMLYDQSLWSRMITLEGTLQYLRRTMPLQMELTSGTMGLGDVFVTTLAYDMLRRHRDSGRHAVPATEPPSQECRGRTRAWGSLVGSSLG